MIKWPTISKQLEEQLDLIRYLGRDEKHRSVWEHRPFIDVHKDFCRIIKMRGLGRELKPASYKKLKLKHLNHGTDAWEIRLYTDRSYVSINKDNWAEFNYYVRSLMHYAPSSAASFMAKYPHVRLGSGVDKA